MNRNTPVVRAHLLGVESDNERRNVDHLLADSDVPLSDQDSSVVDRLGQSALEDLGLQSSLHEVFGLQGQDVIESHTGVVQDTNSHQSSDQGVTLEESLGVLVVELEQFSGSSSDLSLRMSLKNSVQRTTSTHLGQGQLNPVDLSLVSETIFTGKLYAFPSQHPSSLLSFFSILTLSSASNRADS